MESLLSYAIKLNGCAAHFLLLQIRLTEEVDQVKHYLLRKVDYQGLPSAYAPEGYGSRFVCICLLPLNCYVPHLVIVAGSIL